MRTTESGDGQVVKLHRGVGQDKTEGRALLAGTIARSASGNRREGLQSTRTPWTAAISTDKGITWTYRRHPENSDRQTFAYTRVAFDRSRGLRIHDP